MPFIKKYFIYLILLLLTFSGCSNNIFRKADIKDTPINVNDRVKRNIEEGRGIRFGKGSSKGGTFDFASSNELWRASMDVLDFVPFSNASYSGGILITEWFDGNSNDKNEKRDLKITVRFLTNEIRSDALDISIHERKCQSNGTTCSVNKIKSELEPQIGLAILKRAAILEKKQFSKNSKDYLSKKRTTLEKKKINSAR
ncbi:DUF3576 domain-containing protein [Candidatus Pelagibacter sp. Uisw_121]|uniref:DUF3576 domain-containing protein n=1 Tax=Candidatus Pelagibacter sp. Uisw_121 TaxID=3230987 RepID=UPI0039E8B019